MQPDPNPSDVGTCNIMKTVHSHAGHMHKFMNWGIIISIGSRHSGLILIYW